MYMKIMKNILWKQKQNAEEENEKLLVQNKEPIQDLSIKLKNIHLL